MDPNALEITLKAHLKEMSGRLNEAAGIARAADACAEAGNLPTAIEIARDLEQILYEVNTRACAVPSTPARAAKRVWSRTSTPSTHSAKRVKPSS